MQHSIRTFVPQAKTLCVFLAWLATSGCSLFFGNVKVVERSTDYRVLDLAQAHPNEWAKLTEANAKQEDSNQGDGEKQETAISDLAFQSKKTDAIISVNSTCRPNGPTPSGDLKSQTKLLLLGMTKISADKKQEEMTVSGEPALQTTAEGKINVQLTKLRAVVLRKGKCTYDLVYISEPKLFAEYEALFAQFVGSLKL